MTIIAHMRVIAVLSIVALAIAGCGNGDDAADDSNVIEDGTAVADDANEPSNVAPAADPGPGYAKVIIGDEVYEVRGLTCQFGNDFFTYRGTTSEATGAALIAGNGRGHENAATLDVYYEGSFAGGAWTTDEWEGARGILFDDPSFSVDVEAGTLSGRADFLPKDSLGNYDTNVIVEGSFDIDCP